MVGSSVDLSVKNSFFFCGVCLVVSFTDFSSCIEAFQSRIATLVFLANCWCRSNRSRYSSTRNRNRADIRQVKLYHTCISASLARMASRYWRSTFCRYYKSWFCVSLLCAISSSRRCAFSVICWDFINTRLFLSISLRRLSCRSLCQLSNYVRIKGTGLFAVTLYERLCDRRSSR